MTRANTLLPRIFPPLCRSHPNSTPSSLHVIARPRQRGNSTPFPRCLLPPAASAIYNQSGMAWFKRPNPNLGPDDNGEPNGDSNGNRNGDQDFGAESTF